MRITRVTRPEPDVGCLAEDLFPVGYLRAPARFLARRPPAYWDALRRQCELRYGCDVDAGCDPATTTIHPDGPTVADRCAIETAPVEDQWAGALSAFDDGALIDELRAAAVTARDDSIAALAAAADAAVEDIELARALVDLAVTGAAAFARFRATRPTAEDNAARLADLRPALTAEQRLGAARWARERALAVAAALRTGYERGTLGWLATSAADDPPGRPVNVPVTRYPQFDLAVAVPAGATHAARTVRTRAMIAAGDAPLSAAPPAAELVADPLPTIAADARVIVFLHGHSSRLEECESLLGPLTRRGFTIVAMDLPSCGYSEMVDHAGIRDGGSEAPLSGRASDFPVLDFHDAFLVAFIEALGAATGRDLGAQIAAVIGGSLGGNLALRLARRNPLLLPFAANTVPWSAASVWTPAAGSREVGATTARDRAWEAETAPHRRGYFHDVFDFSARALFVRPQPEYWYRDDDWEPCKTRHIQAARADRQEIYNATFRRWHWRVAMEQLWFSHREPARNHQALRGRMLLAAATGDNYEWSNIHDATRELALLLLNTPGRLLSLDRTGHSIHVERPEVFARLVAAFCPPPAPSGDDPERWSEAASLGGPCSADAVALAQEDGRLVVFARDDTGRIRWRRADAGGWSAWASLDAGLERGEGLADGLAVAQNQSGHLELFATLDSHPWLAHVWQDGANGTWRGWEKGNHLSQLIGDASADVAVVERVGDGPSRLLLAVARTRGGRIHVRGQNRLGSWWMNGHDVGDDSVTLAGRPAVAADARGHLHIVVRDDSGTLQHTHENAPDDWAPRWIDRGAVGGDAAIALDAGGRLHVCVRGPDGDLRLMRERTPAGEGDGSWAAWRSLGGTLSADARPALTRNAWGQLQVFARFDDGSVRSRRQLDDASSRWSEWQVLASATRGSPAVAPREDGTLALFVRAADDTLHYLHQRNDYVEPPLARAVTASAKRDGRIMALCHPGEPWSPRAAADAIRDIETGAHTYYVERDAPRTGIHVVDGADGKYLRSDPDGVPANNLDALPDC
ncbi:MAG: alpha/beta fold hydrolase [Gammaproteobacteria bacterium]